MDWGNLGGSASAQRTKGIVRFAAIAFACFCLLFLTSRPAFSQGGDTGRILGAITDQTGGSLVGAMVTVTDTQRGTSRVLTTNDAGEFNAPALIPGTYSIKAEVKGFRATERQNIQVEVGHEYRVDLTLQPGEQTQTVTVTEALPLVETTNATLGGTISNQLIADLPVQGRNFTKLLELRPGVYIAPGSGKWSQSSNGMRREHNVYILDGVDTIEGFSSQTVVNATGIFGDSTAILPIDAIQEFQTQQVPKAEYGWKPGAIVTVGLKSGTNSMHGTAYAFGRTSGLDAANWAITAGQPKQYTKIIDFGATAGGAIKKDKLFYLFGYEGQRNALGSTSQSNLLPTTSTLVGSQLATTAVARSVLDACNALASAPSNLSLLMSGLTYNPALPGGNGNPAAPTFGSRCAVDPNNSGVFQNGTALTYSVEQIGINTLDNGLSKIDFHPNDKHTISGEYFVANFDSVAPQNNAAAQPWWDTATHAKSMVLGLHWTWLPTSTMVNELSGGFNRYNQQSYPADCNNVGQPALYSAVTAAINANTTPMVGVGLPANCGFPNIVLGSPFQNLGCCSSFPKIQGPDWTDQVLDNLSYIRGRHSFKFGQEDRRVAYTGGTYGGSKGSFNFTNLTNFLTGTFNPATLPSLLIGQPGRNLSEWAIAAYAQDDWRITNRITINYGVRYETVTPFTDKNNLLANFDPNSATGLVQANGGLFKRGNNWSPRLGLAWDVTGDAKWVVRTGASLIYVIEGYNAFVSQQNVAGVSVLGLNFNPTGALLNGTPGPGTISTAQFSPTSGVNWSLSGVFPAGAATATPACTTTSPCNILGVDPNFKRPYATAWNLSIQHPFNNSLALQVAYVGSHGSELMGMNDINAPAFGSGWQVAPVGASTTCTNFASSAALVAGKVSAPCENFSRPFFSKFPYLSHVIEIENSQWSNYHALQATLTQRPWHGMSYLVGYTYGHSLSAGNGDWNGANVQSNPFDVRSFYGNSENDVRQRMTISWTYALPDHEGYAQMLKGWKLTSVVNVQSALPWSVTDTTNDISGLGTKNDQWSFFGNTSDYNGRGNNPVPFTAGLGDAACASKAAALDAGFTPVRPFLTYTNALAKYGCYDANGSLLMPAAFGSPGNSIPGMFRGVGVKLWDASLTKDVKFTERFSGTFRFEAFNVLNHTTYSSPVATMAAAGNINFGASTSSPDVQVSNPSVGSGAPRGFQMGLRLLF